MSTVTFLVQRVTIVSPTSPPVQVHMVTLKYPEGETIPTKKSMPPRPVIPILNTWRHDPRLRYTRASALAELVIQEHLNHIYHPVTGQHETYDKLKFRHPKRWIASMSNELGRFDSGVGDGMSSGTDTIF